MSTYQPGEIVDITIKGARIVNTYQQTRRNTTGSITSTVLAADYTDGVERSVAVRLDAPSVTVERVAPAEWPPQPGDLWRDRNGRLHFAVDYAPDYDDRDDAKGIGDGGTRVVLVEQGADESAKFGSPYYRPETVNRQVGPLSLVYREPAGGDR